MQLIFQIQGGAAAVEEFHTCALCIQHRVYTKFQRTFMKFALLELFWGLATPTWTQYIYIPQNARTSMEISHSFAWRWVL